MSFNFLKRNRPQKLYDVFSLSKSSEPQSLEKVKLSNEGRARDYRN